MLKGLVIAALLLQFPLSAATEFKTIDIGIISNFSEISHSSANPYVNAFKNGVEFAILKHAQQLEEHGLKIKLQEFDYGTSPVRVLNAAKAAIASPVVATVGYNFSSHALIAAPLHRDAKLPMITPSATADRLGTFEHYVHRVCFSNRAMGKALADFSQTRLKAVRAAVVVAADCAYCEDLAQAFGEEFTRKKGELVVVSKVLETDTDFSRTVALLKNRKFDVVLVPNQELVSARIISSLVKAGVHKPFLGGDGWGDRGEEFLMVLKSSPSPVAFQGYAVSHWHFDLRSHSSRSFVKEYSVRYRQDPKDTAVLAYDAMSLLLQALFQTQDYTREGIERSLSRIRVFEGITGTARFEGTGTPIKSLILLSTARDHRGQPHFKLLGRIPP
jgi:branched-chain amino acid transport system substrate-binding protein